ncbi:MAG: hypothetical protein ACRC92_26600 [Peptostreptococcaceae bacterium]
MTKRRGRLTLTVFYNDDASLFTTCVIVGKTTFMEAVRFLESVFADSMKNTLLKLGQTKGEHRIHGDLVVKDIMSSEPITKMMNCDVTNVTLIEEHNPSIRHKGFNIRHRAKSLCDFEVINGFLNSYHMSHEERVSAKYKLDEDLVRLGVKNYSEAKLIFSEDKLNELRDSDDELTIIESYMVAEHLQALVVSHDERNKNRILN